MAGFSQPAEYSRTSGAAGRGQRMKGNAQDHVGQIVAALLVLLTWAVASGASAATVDAVPTISALRHHLHDDRLRLMLDISPPSAFALFTLTEPDRLVIDFPELDWQVEDAIEGIPYVNAVRHGLFRHDRARIVIELTEPVEVERAVARPAVGSQPDALLIDLRPVSRGRFNGRAGAPEQARWQSGVPPAMLLPRPDEVVVAIDPGHGGIDPGAREGGLVEKVVVLDFSHRLAAAIEEMEGFRAYLTREDDIFLPLAERISRAREAGANLMISVHADVLERGQARGVAAYTLSKEGTDEATVALAARENRADILAGVNLGGEEDDVTRLLVELSQRGTRSESSKLAAAVLEAVSTEIPILEKRPHRQANFRVLKAPDMPSILLELGFLDHPDDRRRLSDPDGLEKTARAVAAGIAKWREQASSRFLKPR